MTKFSISVFVEYGGSPVQMYNKGYVFVFNDRTIYSASLLFHTRIHRIIDGQRDSICCLHVLKIQTQLFFMKVTLFIL